MRELAPLFLSIVGAGAATLLFLIGLARFLRAEYADGIAHSAMQKLRSMHPDLLLLRADENPILPKRDFEFEAGGVLNPGAVIDADGRVHLFYRTIGKDGVSRIGYASSADGVHVDEQLPYPIFELPLTPDPLRDFFMRNAYRLVSSSPLVSGRSFAGAEDPRAVIMGDNLLITFSAFYGPSSLRIGLLTLPLADLRARRFNWTSLDFLSPADQVHKNWVLFPEKIKGKYAVLHNLHGKEEDEIQIEYCDDLSKIGENGRIESLDPKQLPARPAAWHKRVRAAGPPPLKTDAGWLLLYHANDANLSQYKLGAMLLDLEDPTCIIARSPVPILEPMTTYENNGAKEGVVYACGAVVRNGTLMVYYGGSDSFVCVASAPLAPFLKDLERQAYAPSQGLASRSRRNPILSPIAGHPWESAAVMNAASIDIDGTIHILYRAMGDDRISTFGYASSKDGVTIDERLALPVYAPREAFETRHPNALGNSGCEDPRLTLIGDTLYLCYTAYDGVNVTRGALSAISKADFVAHTFSWSTPKLVTPGKVNDKDVCIFKNADDAKVFMLHRIDPDICLTTFDSLDFKSEISSCLPLLKPRPGRWDSKKVGAGGTPIQVGQDWLLTYHGIGDDHAYRLGAALLSKDGTVIARTNESILEPSDEWEVNGNVPNVVFSCGQVARGDTLFIYYGGGDKVLCVATLSIAALLHKLAPKTLPQ